MAPLKMFTGKELFDAFTGIDNALRSLGECTPVEHDRDELAGMANQLSARCTRYRETLASIRMAASAIAKNTPSTVDLEHARSIVALIDAALGEQ